MRRDPFACFGGCGRRLVRSAPCMDFGTLRRLLFPPRRLLRPPWFPPDWELLLPWLFCPLLPPRPRPREPRDRVRRLVFSPWPFSAWVLPSELFSALPEVLDFCPAAFSGAWKTGEAASFEAVSCASAGGPAFRVTLRGRFRDSFIL